MTTTMEIKRTDDGLELSCPVVSRDYHIRSESAGASESIGWKWVLDEFDTTIEDNNAAHIESQDFGNLEDAINEAFDLCEKFLYFG